MRDELPGFDSELEITRRFLAPAFESGKLRGLVKGMLYLDRREQRIIVCA
jgi:hypothetical protein